MEYRPLIAIVDDDDDIRDALSDLLFVLGFSCRAFESAEAFLIADETSHFDCLITDIRMPGMDGLELMQVIKASGSIMPVIVVTSVVDQVTATRALVGGAHRFLTKPVSEQVLVESVRSALLQPPSRGE